MRPLPLLALVLFASAPFAASPAGAIAAPEAPAKVQDLLDTQCCPITLILDLVPADICVDPPNVEWGPCGSSSGGLPLVCEQTRSALCTHPDPVCARWTLTVDRPREYAYCVVPGWSGGATVGVLA